MFECVYIPMYVCMFECMHADVCVCLYMHAYVFAESTEQTDLYLKLSSGQILPSQHGLGRSLSIAACIELSIC